ncbi:MAG: hypothetical protein ACI8ZM_004028 [Crocinitomix sp.]|jgi:hypothetical protein
MPLSLPTLMVAVTSVSRELETSIYSGSYAAPNDALKPKQNPINSYFYKSRGDATKNI